MKRVGLVIAVSVLAGCGSAPGVPQWKDGVALPASPGVIGSEPAVLGNEPAVTGSEPAADRAPGVAAGSPVPLPSAAVTPSEESPRSPEEFTAAVRGRLPEVAVDRRPEEIAEIGDVACAELSSGQRRGTAVDQVAGYGVSGAEARELVRLARAHLCPA